MNIDWIDGSTPKIAFVCLIARISLIDVLVMQAIPTTVSQSEQTELCTSTHSTSFMRLALPVVALKWVSNHLNQLNS